MSSPVILHQLDEPQRQTALDPTRSFTVRAPAGSGKTELLIQRFLRLLAVVTKPESIVAITFTRKAAGEMLDRVLGALHAAKAGTPVEKPHMQTTRELALAVLQRDRELAWDLLDHPGRLRVQTIDSLCMSITGEMPWLARLGGMPRIEEDARQLYEEAAHLTLLDSSPDYQQALTTLLRHLDNNSTHARELIASMLAKRDQWAKLAVDDDENQARAGLESALADTVVTGLAAVDDLIPEDQRETWLDLARFTTQTDLPKWPEATIANVPVWVRLANVVLNDSAWRKRKGLNKTCGFPLGSDAQKNRCADLIAVLEQREGLLEALKRLRRLPPPAYTNEQWEVLQALLRSLKLAVAQLKMVFREERVIDFMELGIAAREALGHIDNPTEVAYRMDSRIEHLLVDEFQDTSRAQFELLQQLTGGWQPGDGRTLFLVGDPMQSIYRFRQAEVGLFGAVEDKGIGDLQLQTLQLRLNRRSGPAIVERVNALFRDRFPKVVDDQTGAVTYTDSKAAQTEPAGVITVDGFVEGEDQLEAACVDPSHSRSSERRPRRFHRDSSARPLPSVRHHRRPQNRRAPLQRRRHRFARRTLRSARPARPNPRPAQSGGPRGLALHPTRALVRPHASRPRSAGARPHHHRHLGMLTRCPRSLLRRPSARRSPPWRPAGSLRRTRPLAATPLDRAYLDEARRPRLPRQHKLAARCRSLFRSSRSFAVRRRSPRFRALRESRRRAFRAARESRRSRPPRDDHPQSQGPRVRHRHPARPRPPFETRRQAARSLPRVAPRRPLRMPDGPHR